MATSARGIIATNACEHATLHLKSAALKGLIYAICSTRGTDQQAAAKRCHLAGECTQHRAVVALIAAIISPFKK